MLIAQLWYTRAGFTNLNLLLLTVLDSLLLCCLVLPKVSVVAGWSQSDWLELSPSARRLLCAGQHFAVAVLKSTCAWAVVLLGVHQFFR